MKNNQYLADYLISLLANVGIQTKAGDWIFQSVALTGILLIALVSSWLTKSILNSSLRKLVSKSKNGFDDELHEHGFFIDSNQQDMFCHLLYTLQAENIDGL